MRKDEHVAATQGHHDSMQHLLPFLTVAEVAATLNISQRTVRHMVRDGRLAAVATSSVRGRLRVSRDALAAFLASAKVKTTSTAVPSTTVAGTSP